MNKHILAAKLIRKDVKRAFPSTKISVTSEAYSMGNCVNITWSHGPEYGDMRRLTNKYAYGHFDGRTDTYEHSNKRDDIPQTMFINLQRYTD